MSKENAGAEPREKTAVAFPLTVAAKGTRNPRRYGYVARMRQRAQSTSRRAAAESSRGFQPTVSFEQGRASRQRRLTQPSLTRRNPDNAMSVG
ncbi:MAG: hypothetical protein IPK58_06065 [Acidobacteria bacterium]|nr:hypothetical protein [Acidobacteriota bacterium]